MPAATAAMRPNRAGPKLRMVSLIEFKSARPGLLVLDYRCLFVGQRREIALLLWEKEVPRLPSPNPCK